VSKARQVVVSIRYQPPAPPNDRTLTLTTETPDYDGRQALTDALKALEMCFGSREGSHP